MVSLRLRTTSSNAMSALRMQSAQMASTSLWIRAIGGTILTPSRFTSATTKRLARVLTCLHARMGIEGTYVTLVVPQRTTKANWSGILESPTTSAPNAWSTPQMQHDCQVLPSLSLPTLRY